MTTRLRDCGMAISLGPTARLIPAWGIAPEKRPQIVPQRQRRGSSVRKGLGAVAWRRPGNCDMAISSGPTARLIPAWGIAPGINAHKLFPSANGAVHRCETVWV